MKLPSITDVKTPPNVSNQERSGKYWDQYKNSLNRWKNVFKATLISFTQVGLISAQVKFIQFNAYPMIFLVSLGISLCWFYNVNLAVGRDRAAKIGYLIGAASGAVIMTWLCGVLL